MADPLPINDSLTIPGQDLSYEYARSGGPGGQHVNTSDTAVRLRFDLRGTKALHGGIKRRIREAEPGRITSDGELLVTCEANRSRQRNLDEARDKLVAIVRKHLVPPKPRRKTKPSKSAKRRRTDAKTKRGKTKALRGKVRRQD